MDNAEYYIYPSSFLYDRYAVSDDNPHISSRNEKMKNVVFIKTAQKQDVNNVFLEKVLSAVDIESPSEYDIHYVETAPDWLEVKKIYPKLQFFLSFGFRPREFGLQTHNEYNQWIYLNKCRLIFSQALDSLEPDAQLKMQLWNQLKKFDRS